MKKLILIAAMTLPGISQAACRQEWVDHDFNTFTPPVLRQVCDNSLDLPGYNIPPVRPIQRPQIQPIQPPTVPPIGTSNCRLMSVYNEFTRMWETRRVCQ